MKSSATGLRRIFKAFQYSFNGLKSTWKNETAFKQDICVVIIGIIALCFMSLSALWKVFLFFSLIFILLMELVNTAIETIVDRISTKQHALSKQAKDIGSALVLLAFINALVCWGVALFL